MIWKTCPITNKNTLVQPAKLPPVDNLRASSATVAEAVTKQAVKDGVATKQPENWVQAVQDAMWQAVYAA